MVADRPGRHTSRPPDDLRDPQAALVHRALVSAQPPRGFEEILAHVEARLRAVVGIEDHDGLFVDTQALKQVQHPANVAVEAGDHRCVGRPGIR